MVDAIGTRQYLRVAELRAYDKLGIGRDYTGLRVQFKIEKTNESRSNKAVIKVFNLNPDSRTFLEGDDMRLELKAGYPGALEIVAAGDITKAVSIRKHPDWITEIELKDGGKALKENHVDFSFKAGTPYQAILTAALEGLGVTQGPSSFALSEIAIGGFSFSGTAKELLDKLARRFGLEWSVQNEAVQIGTEGTPLPALAPLVTSQTGLIGNVIKREKGIEFKTLLNGEIIPKHPVTVNSQDIAGEFEVRKVTIDGDTHGGPWYSMVEAEAIG